MRRSGRIVAVALCLVVGVYVCGAVAADHEEKAAKPDYPEVTLKGDVLLVNLKTMDVPFILKDHRLVSIGGKAFLQGTYADIGDEHKHAGLKVSLAVEDITAIREFAWEQAKAYYGAAFREKR